ncbi:hypothetical protein L3Q82_020738, partial [Scortum barcoo]
AKCGILRSAVPVWNIPRVPPLLWEEKVLDIRLRRHRRARAVGCPPSSPRKPRGDSRERRFLGFGGGGPAPRLFQLGAVPRSTPVPARFHRGEHAPRCHLYRNGQKTKTESVSPTPELRVGCEKHTITFRAADAVVFTIQAIDAENDPLTYTLTGANAVYFTVNRNTGAVSIKRQLDRESNIMHVFQTPGDLTIIINDANDNKPIFQQPSYDITVPEGTTVGTSLFKVSATDADVSNAGVVLYSIDEVGGGNCYFDEPVFFSSIVFSFVTVEDVPDLDPLFTGVPYIGRVEENAPLSPFIPKQHRQQRLLSLEPNIHGEHASTTAKVQINIIDVNDNKPEFYKCGDPEDELSCEKATQFTGEVLEQSLGAVSINMTVKDLDKIPRIELILLGADKDVFSVEPQFTQSDSVIQLLVQVLVQITRMKHDMEGITGRMLLCLLGLISMTNDANAVVFTIQATDAENDPLTYTLTGANAVYFTVNRNTGAVSIKRQLDREGNGDVIMLGVIVSDGPNDVSDILARVNIHLMSVHYIRTFQMLVLFYYSIDEVTPNAGVSLFSIVSTSGWWRQLLFLMEPVFFSSVVVFSFVTVEDVPDLDPLFTGVPYIGRVEENAPLDTSVFQVSAVDQDRGVNDRIIYSIEESTPAMDLFKISSADGIISVSSSIDRETIGDRVTLTVKATESQPNIHGEHASTTANVQIDIIDVNDNKPEFYKCGDPEDELSCVKATEFTGEVLEHSLGAVSINMMVKDLDKIPRIELTLLGADKDVFSVEPQFTQTNSVVQLLVKQPQNLDFEEKQEMVLQVIAKDQEEPSFQSTATVTIKIKDANDNSPKFPKDTYKLTVPEHSPVGTTLATITAEDPDTMDQNNITYSLLPESILLYFDVKPRTGEVYVKNSTLLDREVRSLYSATLQARDTEDKPGSTVLEITVTDINDQPPVMNRNSYLEFVKEGGQFELKIEATDADDPDTENSQIVYGILPSKYSNNFTIDPNTGVLRNVGELDLEAMDPKLNGRIELNVTATDKGNPPLSSMATVIINVEDVNDNVPHFGAPSYTFYVKEGEKGAFVGSVSAEDLDQTTQFNRITFSIIDGSFGSFNIRTFQEIRGYGGNITVDPDIELDYESARKQFKLRVDAADLEQKRAEVMVEVNVLDVNDERPEFKPTPPVTVKENTTISGAIGRFTGQDKDGNHSLIYELESIKCRCNGSLTPCNNFILDPTGEVTVNPETVIDYEECDQVLIEAQVVDEYTEKGANNSVTTGQMVINIEDINDNAPEFIWSNKVFVVVSESASKGTSVAGVTAIDRDSGVNRQIEFEVAKVQFEDTNNHTSNMRTLFEAVTTQQNNVYVGIIQTTEGLDIKLRGKYLVTLTATDTGGLSTSAVLDIFTVDETYKVELEFAISAEEVEKKLIPIISALTAATMAGVEIVAIRASGNSIVVAYFVYSNGTALTSTQVEAMLSVPKYAVTLAELGLMNIGTPPLNEQQTDPVMYGLLGMVGGLIIVLAVLTTSLLCTRRNYRRKLKAAKAMNSASMVTSDNQKSGAVVPGTNKYTMEGANPVLNLNIDTTLVLDLDEESSDVDKVSLNSLDYSDDMTPTEKDGKSSMMIHEEEEEDNGPPEYIEPLGEALAQRGQRKGANNSHLAFDNPAFSTTDL